MEEGMTQTSIKGPDSCQGHIFNFPLDVSWKSSNPSGCNTLNKKPHIILLLQGHS